MEKKNKKPTLYIVPTLAIDALPNGKTGIPAQLVIDKMGSSIVVSISYKIQEKKEEKKK